MASPTGVSPPTGNQAPGWYSDPSGRYQVRWWTGLGWSASVRTGNAISFAPLPRPGPDGTFGDSAADELANLEYVEHFLQVARANHIIGAGAYGALTRRVIAFREPLVARLLAAAKVPDAPQSPVVPQVTEEVTAGAPAPVPPSAPVSSPAPRPGPAPARPVREPSAARRRWQAAGETVRSDLAVNGLAYLGVLLLFAGLFGVVAFSFTSVRVGFRPLAEAVVPAAVFGSAWMLARRTLVTPARALVLLGGLLVPVAALATFTDGAPVPPDLTGVPLAVALSATSAAVAVGYAAWIRHRPSSPLRHLVAPVMWLAVALAALGWYEPVPTGQDILVPRSGQYAAVLAAITVTLAVSRIRVRSLVALTLFPAVLVGLGVGVLLAALAAGVEGWPAVPVAVAGAATLLALELSGRQVPATPRLALQGLVVGLTGMALAPALGPGWAGASAAVAGVAVIERGLRRSVSGYALLAPIVVTVAGLGFAVWTPPALLVASAVTSGWAQARRLWPGGWRYPVMVLTVTAAAAPAGILAGLLGALPAGPGAGVAGLLLLSGAVAVRVLGRATDRFWQWWIPAAAVAVSAVTAGQGPTAWFVVAAGAATVAIAIAPVPAALRTWLAGAAALWTAWLAFEVTGLGFPVRMVAIAGAALAAVGFAGGRRDPLAGHIGMFGHLAGLACWPLAAVDAGRLDAAAPTAVLGLAVTGAVITAAAQEIGPAAVPDLLVRCGRVLTLGLTAHRKDAAEAVIRQVPAMAAVVLLIPFTADLIRLSGARAPRPWWPVALTALGLAYLLLARLLRPWHRVARVLADVGAWAAVLAAAACTHREPALVATAGVMAVPVLQDAALRRRAAIWLAWAASVPFAVLAANLAGLAESYWYAVTLGWGAVLFLGGLIGDDVRASRRQPGERVRTGWLIPPAAIGLLACTAGLMGSASGSLHQAGWMLIAAGVVVIAAAALLRAGVLGGAGTAMAIAGLGVVVPWGLSAHPWLLLVAAAVVLAAADITGPPAGSQVALWQRWDLSLFVVAHAAALFAVGLAAASGTAVAVTTVGCGTLAAAVAARLLRWPWAAGGAVLILAGAAAAGAGWASLAFAMASVIATGLALGRPQRIRAMLQAAGALAAVAAWAAGLVWREVSLGTAVSATSIAAGAVVLVAATAIRIWEPARDWTLAWGGTGLALAAVAAAALSAPAVPSGSGVFVAAGLAATAIGCALAAGPVAVTLLRETAAVLAVAAALTWAYGTSAGLATLTWCAVVAGLAASVIVLAPWTRKAAPIWVRPVVLVAVAGTGVALGAAAASLPDTALLVPAFILAAAVIVALAVALDRPILSAAAPVPLCAAWLTYAFRALTGQPQWFTMPAGVAIIAVAGVLRSARRAGGRPVATPDVVALEITGMGLVMGTSLVQAVTRGPGYSLLGAGLALGLVGWGALTRVRRRLLGGTIAFCASLLMLIAVPLAGAVPHLGGVAVWLALAGAGLVAIIGAALLDATRAVVRRGVSRIADLTRDWE